jgi:hypothetical protein
MKYHKAFIFNQMTINDDHISVSPFSSVRNNSREWSLTLMLMVRRYILRHHFRRRFEFYFQFVFCIFIIRDDGSNGRELSNSLAFTVPGRMAATIDTVL